MAFEHTLSWLVESAAEELQSKGLRVQPSDVLAEPSGDRDQDAVRVSLSKDMQQTIEQFRQHMQKKPEQLTDIEQNNKLTLKERVNESVSVKEQRWADLWNSADPRENEEIRAFAAVEVQAAEVQLMPENMWPTPAKFSKELHPYFKECGLPMAESEPRKPRKGEFRKLQETFGRKGTVNHFKKPRKCDYCGRWTHPVGHCELIVELSRVPAYLRDFAKFIRDELPLVEWEEHHGSEESSVRQLPAVLARLRALESEAWREWAKPSPFRSGDNEWFPQRGRAAILFKWAMGYSKQQLLRELAGSQSKWLRKPPRVNWGNCKSTESQKAKSVIDEWVEEGLKLGLHIPVPTNMARVILGLKFVEGDETRRDRVCINGAPENFFEAKYAFRNPNLAEFTMHLDAGHRIGTMDQVKAFMTKSVSAKESLFQCFQWPDAEGNPVTYAAIAENFGRCNTPHRFFISIKPVENFLRKIGLFTRFFMDDGPFRMSPIDIAGRVQANFLMHLFNELRWPVHPKKTHIHDATTTAKWIGYVIDTAARSVTVDTGKTEKIRRIIQEILDARAPTVKQLQRVHGMLNAAREALSFVPILTQNINQAITLGLARAKEKGRNQWGEQEKVRLTDYVVKELEFWRDNIHTVNGQPIWDADWDHDIYIDASDTLAASFCDRKVTQIPLPPEVAKASSTFRELYGSWLALHSRRHELSGRSVRVFTDNSASATMMQRNGANAPDMIAMTKLNVATAMAHGIRVWWRWKRRSQPGLVVADAISKTPNAEDWSFNLRVRAAVLEALQLPNPTIDGCASSRNATCAKYISQFYDGSCTAVDLLSEKTKKKIDWENEILWINPPFRNKMIQDIIEFIIASKVRAYLVVPVWIRFAFYKLAKDRAQAVVYIAPNSQLYGACDEYKSKNVGQRWATALCIFNARSEVAGHFEWSWATGTVTAAGMGETDRKDQYRERERANRPGKRRFEALQ